MHYIWGTAKQTTVRISKNRKVKDFGSLSSESIYNFGGNFVYLKHPQRVDTFVLCTDQEVIRPTGTSNRNFHVLPCFAYYKSFLFELIQELEQRHA